MNFAIMFDLANPGFDLWRGNSVQCLGLSSRQVRFPPFRFPTSRKKRVWRNVSDVVPECAQQSLGFRVGDGIGCFPFY